MSSASFDTVIIGGGIAGLACARQLQEHHQEFLLISKDIGGRIRTSEDGTVNYGAFFVCSDYNHVLPFVKIHRRIKLSDFCFHEDDTHFGYYSPQLMAYLPQLFKVKTLLHTFRKAFRRFRKSSETLSQKQAIEQDPFLFQLYMKNASDYIQEHHLQKGMNKYLSKGLYATTFSSVHNMNAFSCLQFLLPLVTPIYTFTFLIEKMIEPFQKRILLSEVIGLQRKNNCYTIKHKTGNVQTRNVVIATDLPSMKSLTGITKTNTPVSTHMMHIRGTLKKRFTKKMYHLFSPPSNIQAIADNFDGTYLLYYKHHQPTLDRLCTNAEILAQHEWNPAGSINGHTLIESNCGNGLYVIGDCNVAGVEESYITGLYAAHQIING